MNAVHFVPGKTGGLEIYARRLISALEEAERDLRLTVIVSRATAQALRRERWRAELVGLRFDARSRVRGVLAEQFVVPRVVRRVRPDLLHNLLNTGPAWSPVPQVTTIHDLIYRTHPETHAGLRAWGVARLVPLAARRSARIVTVSQATADEVVRELEIPTSRVDVVQNGPGSQPGRATSERDIREALGLGAAPIVLAVSAKRPHKNLRRLIEAMASVEAVLVLPGYATPFEGDLRALADRLGVAERVRFTGWLEDEDVEGLYRTAACVVVPSLAEGFGLPVLEAMVRGVPVTCSDVPALREVAGEAALFFDPLEPDAIAEAITTLLRDERERTRLATAGEARSASFTWERTARETLASYERALAA